MKIAEPSLKRPQHTPLEASMPAKSDNGGDLRESALFDLEQYLSSSEDPGGVSGPYLDLEAEEPDDGPVPVQPPPGWTPPAAPRAESRK